MFIFYLCGNHAFNFLKSDHTLNLLEELLFSSYFFPILSVPSFLGSHHGSAVCHTEEATALQCLGGSDAQCKPQWWRYNRAVLMWKQ
jgi:hypothetical protein